MGCSQSKHVATSPLEFNPPEPSTNVPPPDSPSVSNQNRPAQPTARNTKSNPQQPPPPTNNAPQTFAPNRKISQVPGLEQAAINSNGISNNTKIVPTKQAPAPPVVQLRVGSKVNGSKHAAPLVPMPPDPRWDEVWGALHPYLLDPADVPAVMAELVNKTINRLSPTEVSFLQRRVRNVVGRLPREDKSKMMGRVFSTTSAEVEARVIVEKYHLLDEHVFRKVVGGSLLMQGSGAMLDRRLADPISAAYSIMLHLTSESVTSLWDRVAEIAVESAQRAGLEMDVNKGRKFERIPAPPPQVPEDDSQSVGEAQRLGASFASFSFLVALALRGTRQQRLQLLFYLLLPPAVLSRFLDKHPSGGVPTWLLEVGNECILSLASMTHYYYYGTTFLPSESLAVAEIHQKHPTLLVMSNAVQEILGLLIEKESVFKKKDDSNDSVTPPTMDAPLNKSPSPSRSNSVGPSVFKRRGSNQNEFPSDSPAVERRRTDVMERLHQIAQGKAIAYDVVALSASNDKFRKAASTYADEDENGRPLKWTMAEFALWAEDALDNTALDAIMHRIFVVGILPSPSTERALVLSRWQEWQRTEGLMWSQAAGSMDSLNYVSPSIRKMASLQNGEESVDFRPPSRAWGGLGGFDGRAGVGYGIMYCLEKRWWKDWEDYVGWSWNGSLSSSQRYRSVRPGDMTTESLLDRASESTIAGTLGSYELLKQGLRKDIDYVLVPPAVWDVLYEIYGGGPPVPRMVVPPPPYAHRNRSSSADSKQMEEIDIILDGDSTEIVSTKNYPVLRLPESFEVATHPWILHCQLCDAQQPYRRGDAGPLTIRVMATPDQPLWRLYSELIVRLPVYNSRASDNHGRGKARLWKRVEGAASKDPTSRYGPWVLLCKNRSAILPLLNQDIELEHNFDELRDNWQAFADHTTIEGIGLANGDRIMLEYALRNKDGEFLWPREAAAKAGRVRRLADEDAVFRQTLRGVDEDGKPLEKPPDLVGMNVDAMDTSGRWYQVEILKVETFATEEEEDPDTVIESSEGFGGSAPPEPKKPTVKTEGGERTQVRVDFTEHGGHPEWIDVESDRLATAGRFTMGQQDESPTAQSTSTKSLNVNDAKTKAMNPVKKNGNEQSSGDLSGGKVCTFPGYGACGLSNLGNTCYANSAIQCISYLPLLRAYLLSAQYKATGDLNKDNPLGTSGKLLEETAELLRVMWSAKVGEKSPSRFRTQLAKTNAQFSGADQQDAQEFLNFMLDVLHEDANRVKKKPSVEALEDDWVAKIDLSRVGEEAWRRFLRRNRSIVADVSMGQVLSTVTCPTCGFSSPNFDPFNLLSIPFPTVADVIFRCTVVRRATAFNAPWVLGKSRKLDRKRERFSQSDANAKTTANNYLVEEYVVAMSRLADIDDLKLRLENVCGIPASRLRLTKGEEVVVFKDQDENSPVKYHFKMTPLPDKEGPCIQLTKKDASAASDEVGTTPKEPTHILAFEVTLSARPKPQIPEAEVPIKGDEPQPEEDEETADEEEEDDEDEEEDAGKQEESALSPKELRALEDRLKVYGDDLECRVFDTDPLMISKAISRSLWPRTEDELKLGLRVDAIDHRDHWFPGSVVEIVEGVDNGGDENATKTKVRIHFDNFSSKWDEMYTIDHFTKGQVRPLYLHASPRTKPTEFIVHHRFTDRASRGAALFGQPFYLQCKNEWSTARAGAHILAQTSRFLQRKADAAVGPVDVDELQESEAKAQRLYEKTQSVISELIDLLIDCDREYVRSALGLSRRQTETEDVQPYRNPKFDATTLSTALVKKVSQLLHRLPFEVRVCTADAPLGGKSTAGNDEVPFPFSLMRTIGNYMNARHAIVLHWREPPTDKQNKSRYSNYLNAPVMYVPPPVIIDKASAALLDQSDPKKSKNSPGSGGLHLGVCLTEFCKVQQLPLSDNWKCPRCKEFREGEQSLTLWRLPDLMTFHIKRFNCSARWREKITTKVNFPLTGLDMREWCHKDSPAMQPDTEDSSVYDLIGVINHYGGMTGGHYVATCKATACGRDGSEEVAYSFGGSCVAGSIEMEDESDVVAQVGWRLGRPKVEVNQNRQAAIATARSATESAEPLWLQFDDDLVEPIPPRNVVSELAYVLFYRRRRMTPANIAKYSTLE